MSKVLDAEQCVLVDVEPVVAAPKAPVDKTFRRYDQDQPLLLPPDLRDWLPAEHPARMVDDLVEFGLDLAGIYASYTESRGAPPYDPRLMLKVLIYGYSNGVTSSRALERRCQDDIAFRFLTADAAPDFVAISRFRVRHGAALKALFTQSLALCGRPRLTSPARPHNASDWVNNAFSAAPCRTRNREIATKSGAASAVRNRNAMSSWQRRSNARDDVTPLE